MPNIKAAVKWTRQSEKRRKRNLAVKTRLKTIFKKAKTSGDAATVSSVEAQFDKAAQKGIIHPNKAARKKSRLIRAARVAASAKPVEKAISKGAARKKAASK